jgi:thioredoxin reductase
MTSPVEFPMYGKFKKRELSKEDLLKFWDQVLHRADFKCRTGEKVENIAKGDDGVFTLSTAKSEFRGRHVILALGKSGSPRKLGVKGEELAKVMYRLIEADHYVNKKILIVGGGDSAVEAAMGLACQVGNEVTLSYRQAEFSRIKDRNAQRIAEFAKRGKLKVLFNSKPVEFTSNAAVIEVNGGRRTIANDFVWVFAGGDPPTAFLKKVGIGFAERDMTTEGSREAKLAKEASLTPAG